MGGVFQLHELGGTWQSEFSSDNTGSTLASNDTFATELEIASVSN
jgi:hypothetical protein